MPCHNIKRLSATDISALASMKNVAKCDTWCELQNPANHRVFERKLRPRPLGRGHACLGVTPNTLPPLIGWWDAACGSPSCKGRWAEDAAAGVSCRTQRVVGDLALLTAVHTDRSRCYGLKDPKNGALDASTATPSQAGLPAEFKHINKRRRRNLQGFP